MESESDVLLRREDLMDRVDDPSHFANRQGLLLGWDQLLGIDVPTEIWHLLVLVDEVVLDAVLHHVRTWLCLLKLVQAAQQGLDHAQRHRVSQGLTAVSLFPSLMAFQQHWQETAFSWLEKENELVFLKQDVDGVLVPQQDLGHHLHHCLGVGVQGSCRRFASVLPALALVGLGLFVFLDAQAFELAWSEQVAPDRTRFVQGVSHWSGKLPS